MTRSSERRDALQHAGEGPRSAATIRDSVHAKAVQLVRLAHRMTTAAGSGHPTSAASLAHLVTVLLYDHMRWDPGWPDHPASDRLVLSEGHACPIVYAAAADLGVVVGTERQRALTVEDAMQLRAIDSPLDGHPNPLEGFPFFPAATGSLGQGLSVAAGLALVARLDGLRKRVFCAIGDGEAREGQIWEALDFLVDHRLSSVCAIFNANGYGQTGGVSRQQSPEALAEKLAAYGVEPLVFDGHDPDAIHAALAQHAARAEQDATPIVLVARTVKGWGTPTLASRDSGSHGKPADDGEELERALAELDAKATEVGARFTEGALHVRAVPEAPPERRARVRREALPTLAEVLEESGKGGLLEEKKLATRKAYGFALRALGRALEDVVAIDGDVSNSTYTETFADEHDLAPRYFEARIAEQNLFGVAAGLAAGGKIPFASTFGKFVTRAYDQIEMALVGGQALRLVGSHVGVSLAADGPSQMALPDVAWFASLARVRRRGEPLMYVLTPADATSAYALTIEMAFHDGASYLRTLRPDVPLLYADDERFELGGHKVLAEGADVAILATGYMVHEARKAVAELAGKGVAATLVDLYSMPFDEEALYALCRDSGGRVVTVEDNYGGAMGAAVAEMLARRGGGITLRPMFVRRVPKSGRTPGAVLELLELSATHISEVARDLVSSPAPGRSP